MREYFVYLSGEFPDLARAELESLLTMLDGSIRASFGRLLLLSSDRDPTHFILRRAALSREAGLVISRWKWPDIPIIDAQEIRGEMATASGFHIRPVIIGESPMKFHINEIIDDLASRIRGLTNRGVSFTKCSARFVLFLTPTELLLARSIKSSLRRSLKRKVPERMPFFHPSIMNPILSRVMCNFARVGPKSIMLDPFCGAGGIIYEAASLGALTIGMDLNWPLLTGAKTNISRIKPPQGNMVQADARFIPLYCNVCDAIVTDPPYGRVSSTRGAKAVQLVEKLLLQADCILAEHGRICICGTKAMRIPRLVSTAGLHIELVQEMRVHRQLTRVIVLAHP